MNTCKKQMTAFFLACILFLSSALTGYAAEETELSEEKQTARPSTVETILGTEAISPTEILTHKKEVEVVSPSGQCTMASLPDLKGVEDVPLTKAQLKEALDPQSEFEIPQRLTRSSSADTINGPSSIISAGSQWRHLNYHSATIDGKRHIAFCVNSRKNPPLGGSYTKSSNNAGFNKTKVKYVNNIVNWAWMETDGFDGYNFSGGGTEGNYERLALQFAVYRCVSGTGGNHSGSWWTNGAWSSNSNKKYLDLANRWYGKRNSTMSHKFSIKKKSQKKSGDTTTYTYTVTAKNISSIAVKDNLPDGVKASLSKDKDLLTVKVDASVAKAFTVVLTGKYTDVEVAYYVSSSSAYQNMAVLIPKDTSLKEELKITPNPEPGLIKVIKKDAKSGEKLAGAKIGVYSDKACTNLLETLVTGANGEATTKKYELGTKLYFKELEAPREYTVVKEINAETVGSGIDVVFKNKRITTGTPGKLIIHKTGSTLGLSAMDSIVETPEGGVDFHYSKTPLGGAVFKVYADSNIYKIEEELDPVTGQMKQKQTLIYAAGELVETITTDDDGTAETSRELYAGTYRIEESQTPEGFVQAAPVKVSLSSNQKDQLVTTEKTVAINNDVPDVRLNLKKKDAVDDVAIIYPAQFGLYAGEDILNEDEDIVVEEGRLIAILNTSNGSASLQKKLPFGYTYVVREIEAPENYILNEGDEFSFTPEYKDALTPVYEFTYTAKDEPVVGYINFNKIDSEKRDGTAQGDATLGGAVYALYARKNIMHPSGNGKVVVPAGTEICRTTTDEFGYGEFLTCYDLNNNVREGLYLGEYYFKEVIPSQGYLLDHTEYDVNLKYVDQYTEVAVQGEEIYATEQVKKQGFQLIKVTDDGEETEMPGIRAGFKIYLIRDLAGVQDGSIRPGKNGIYRAGDFIGYDFTSETPAILYDENPDGLELEELFSSPEDGTLLSPRLPYGQYVVVETTVPEDHAPIFPFVVNVTIDSETPQNYRVFWDKEFTANLRIIKKDSVTGETILKPGTKFKIYDSDNNLVTQHITYPKPQTISEFETDEDGTLMLAEPLRPGSYLIVETHAPDDYVISDPVRVEITNQNAFKTDPDLKQNIIEVDYFDNPAKGQLELTKTGDKLEDFAKTEDGKQEETYIDGKEFTYTEQPVQGAVFYIYAAKNIYHNDNQKDGNGKKYLYYHSGDFVCSIITDEKGKAVAKDLPLGSYYIEEKESGDGFVLNTERKYFEIEYANETTEIIYADAAYKNERQTTSGGMVKSDAEDSDKLIPGAVYGLYAKDKILNHEEEIIVYPNELVRKAVTDKNAFADFGSDIPFGEYYVKELSAPDGYHKDPNQYDISLVYQGQSILVSMYHVKVKDVPTKIMFLKQDTGTGNELSGAKLRIIDKNGKVMDEWITKAGTPHITSGILKVGETYTLQEIVAPEGYLKAPDITFTVTEDDELQVITMEDELAKGKLVVYKRGEVLDSVSTYVETKPYIEYAFHWVEDSLAGIRFDLYAAKDIKHPDGQTEDYYKENELIAHLKTNQAGIAEVTDLPFGEYYLIERETDEEHVIERNPIYVTVSYQGQTVPVAVTNKALDNSRVKVNIHVTKQDGDTKEHVAGAVFGLYAGQDIYNKKGTVLVKKDTLIHIAKTGGNGSADFAGDIPLGKYYVKELKAPDGYTISPDILEFDASYQGPDVKEITLNKLFTDAKTVTDVLKLDAQGKDPLVGALLQVKDKEGNICDQWVSAGVPHRIQGLLAGETYTLKEVEAPGGYLLAEEISFTVKDTKETQVIRMEDDYTKTYISKQDIATGKEVPGAVLEILDKDRNIILTWITGEEPYLAERLPAGDYYLVEKTAPEGYLKAEEVKFTVKETGEIQTVVMKDDFTKTKISKQNEEKKEVPGAVLAVLKADGTMIEQWTTTETPHLIERLPAGSYILRELEAPAGYVKSDDIPFEVKETGEIQTITMLESYTKIDVNKMDTEGNLLPGAVLVLKDGEGNIIETWKSSTEPHRIEKLPVGEYRLEEQEAPRGYVCAKGIDIRVKDTRDVQTFTLYNYETEVEIGKKDKDTKEYLKGAELVLKDDEGNTVDAWTSGEYPHVIKKLAVGTYTLTEKKAPKGYLVAKDKLIEVKNTKKVQKFFLYDKADGEQPETPDSKEKTDKPKNPGKPGTPDAPKKTGTPKKVPKTGDDTVIWPFLMLMGGSLSGFSFYWWKKRKKKGK